MMCWARYRTWDCSLFIFSFHPHQRWWYNHTILWGNGDNSVHRFYPDFMPAFQTLFPVRSSCKLENQCYWGLCLPQPLCSSGANLVNNAGVKTKQGKGENKRIWTVQCWIIHSRWGHPYPRGYSWSWGVVWAPSDSTGERALFPIVSFIESKIVAQKPSRRWSDSWHIHWEVDSVSGKKIFRL